MDRRFKNDVEKFGSFGDFGALDGFNDCFAGGERKEKKPGHVEQYHVLSNAGLW